MSQLSTFMDDSLWIYSSIETLKLMVVIVWHKLSHTDHNLPYISMEELKKKKGTQIKSMTDKRKKKLTGSRLLKHCGCTLTWHTLHFWIYWDHSPLLAQDTVPLCLVLYTAALNKHNEVLAMLYLPWSLSGWQSHAFADRQCLVAKGEAQFCTLYQLPGVIQHASLGTECGWEVWYSAKIFQAFYLHQEHVACSCVLQKTACYHLWKQECMWDEWCPYRWSAMSMSSMKLLSSWTKFSRNNSCWTIWRR